MFGKNKPLRWLYGELPVLVDKGVLSAQAAEALRGHYGDEPDREQGVGTIARAIFAIAGAALIGLGIVLTFGHNWENLTREQRAVLGFLPLVAAQMLAGWSLARRARAAWRETAAVFLSLAVCACLALTAQTYHISGDWGSFLLTWFALTLPLTYLLDAASPAVIALFLLNAWDMAGWRFGPSHVLYWPLAALIVPFYLKEIQASRYGARSVILSWAVAVSASLHIALGIGGRFVLDSPVNVIVLVGFLGVLRGMGAAYFNKGTSAWQRAFLSFGGVALAISAFILSFDWVWARPLSESDNLLWALVLAAVSLGLAVMVHKRESDLAALLAGAMPILALFGFLLRGQGHNHLPAVLFNGYVLAFCVLVVGQGLIRGSLGRVNAGLLYFSALVVARFFLMNTDMLTRGLAFMAVGLVFLGVNIWVLRSRRRT